MSYRLLTVKEVAEIANVSTQYIYKLMKNRLQTYVVEIDNQKQLKDTVITEYFDNELQTVATKNEENTPEINNQFATGANQNDIDFLEYLKSDIQNKNKQLELKDKIIDDKENIIKEKDIYIKELTEKITELTDKLAILFENSQQLQQNQQLLEAQNKRDENEKNSVKQNFFKKMFKNKKN